MKSQNGSARLAVGKLVLDFGRRIFSQRAEWIQPRV